MDKPIRIRVADGSMVDLAVERLNLLDIQRIRRPYDPPLQRDPKHDAFDATMHNQATTSLAILDALEAALSVETYTEKYIRQQEAGDTNGKGGIHESGHRDAILEVRQAARVVEE